MANHELLILLAIVNVYLLAIYVLKRKDLLDGERMSLMGPALMLKTQRGKKLIDRIARPKALWRKYGDVTIAFVVAFGVLMVAFVGWTTFLTVANPPQDTGVGAQHVLAIPGVNPWIPIGYGIVAFVLGIVIHEFAHGILARAHDIKVKSLGVLLLVIPVGAFMEPDEEELQDSHPRTRTRVFAAGAGTSIIVGLLFAGLYGFAFVPAAEPAAPGMGVTTVSPGSPADDLAVKPGMILNAVDGRTLETSEDFLEAFNRTEAGERVQVTIWSSGTFHDRNVTLADRYDYIFERCRADGTDRATCHDRVNASWMSRCQNLHGRTEASCRSQLEEGNISEPFLGVGVIGPEAFLGLHQPGLGLGDNLAFMLLPVQQLSPVKTPFANFFQIQGPLALLGTSGFWIVANTVYWLFWLNFLVGIFNALPLTILDGGHVFDEGVRKIVRTHDPEVTGERVERSVDLARKAVGIAVGGALIVQIAVIVIL